MRSKSWTNRQNCLQLTSNHAQIVGSLDRNVHVTIRTVELFMKNYPQRTQDWRKVALLSSKFQGMTYIENQGDG